MIGCALASLLLLAAEPPLTEQRAAELALRASPSVGALQHGVDEALALETAAGAWANPELRVQNLRSDRLLDGAHEDRLGGARIGLRWTPPRPGESSALVAEAAVRAAVFRADVELSRRSIAAQARRLHAAALALDAELALAREESGERERIRDIVQRRLERGIATQVERSDAELDRLAALDAVQELEIRQAEADGELALLVGRPGAALELSAEGASRCAPPAEDALLAGAERNDPRADVLRAGVQAADAERSRYGLALLPWPSYLQASYVLRSGSTPAYWAFQLGVELPLLDWKRGDRAAAAARRSRLEDEHRAEAAAVAQELRRALAALRAHAALVQRQRDAAAVIEDTLKVYVQRGEGFDALQAGRLRARLAAARRAGAAAELECTLDRIEASRLAGRDG